MTPEAHFGPLIKLDARWALPVYPVLNDQSHWKMCEHILKKKTQRTKTIQILRINKKENDVTHEFSRNCMNDGNKQFWNVCDVSWL